MLRDQPPPGTPHPRQLAEEETPDQVTPHNKPCGRADPNCPVR
jgi:hypothetical protein